MGLSTALYSAISGLTNHQTRMDNIGNNLANVNTIGFKRGVHQFRTLLSQTIKGGTAPGENQGGINPITLGLGTQTGTITQDFTQGALQTTGNQRDLAIEGNGFFLLREANNTVLTRDGAFYIGTDGTLLAGEGMAVQGIMAEDGEFNEAGTVSDVTIPIGQTGGAQETTQVGMTGNLNSDVEVAAPNIISAADATWLSGDTTAGLGPLGNDLNLGHVETSAALWDGVAGAPATPDTALQNLQFLRGTNLVSPFANIDLATTPKEITFTYEKGGRNMTAVFTYGDNTVSPPVGDGTTVEDLATFLTGALGDDGTASNERLLGGAMGTIRPRERTQLVDGYDVLTEHGGSFMRTFGVADAQAVDYGVVTPGVKDVTTRWSIASNLGVENALTDIEVGYNNVTYTDMFTADADYGDLEGGSTTTNLVVYDSLGNSKEVTMQMTLVDRDSNFSTWRWVADSVDDTDASWLFDAFNQDGNAASTSINVGTGLIRFDSDGRFVRGAELSETAGLEVDLDLQGVNFPLTVTLREGLATDLDQDLDFSELTQVASDSDFNLREQNGSPPGTLDTFTVTSDGVINGVFSNGVLQSLARLSVALVPNPQGLLPLGQNLYQEGANSGEPQIAYAGVGGRGAIRAGTLELSNVDLSQEFTDLIVTERGFQANARVVSTSDEMLVELVNLKR